MKRIVLFLTGSLLAFQIQAADVYQWSQGFTGNCTDPTEREDGTTLLASEIANIYYYIDSTDGNVATPAFTSIMAGGCSPVAVDTKQFNTNTTYYRYGVTEDTDGRLSVVSTPGNPFTVVKSRPKPPSNVQ